MCDVLQLALQFWAKQKQNESLKYNQDVKSLRKKLDEAEELNEKLSKVCTDYVFLRSDSRPFLL